MVNTLVKCIVLLKIFNDTKVLYTVITCAILRCKLGKPGPRKDRKASSSDLHLRCNTCIVYITVCNICICVTKQINFISFYN